MSVDKLKRVMMRLRARNPGKDMVKSIELQRAIMIECGTAVSTYKHNKKALVTLGWIKSCKKRFRLTGTDLTEDF